MTGGEAFNGGAIVMPPGIERRPIAELEPYAGNAKRHPPEQIERLAASIARLGFNAPVLISGGTILAGHARIEAAKVLGLSEVPVVVLDHLDADERRAYVLADNRLAELATWNTDQVLTELAALASSDAPELALATGFETIDLENLGDSLEQLAAELNQGPPRAKPKPSKSKRGQLPKNLPPPVAQDGELWKLGRHRVFVGDCRIAKAVGKAIGAEGYEILIADPPYCSGSNQDAQKASGTWGDIAGDNLSARGYKALMMSALNVAKPAAVYLFTDWRMWGQLFDVVESSGLAARAMIVWDKGSPGMGSFWRNQHELIMYAARSGAKRISGEAAHSNVLHYSRTGNKHHFTEKPVDLIGELLTCDGKCGRIGPVFDPFMGSGATLLAAEELGRTCYGMDIEGRWIDVTIERWQELSGGAATRASGARRKAAKPKAAKRKRKATKA